MEHRFNVQFAKDYGIEEAILIENLYFWIAKNVANGKHKHEKRYWTYNSAKAFAELFPYINETKIYRVLAHLEDVEFIIKGKFSQDKHDRTNWYSFSDKGLSRLNAEKYDTINFSETFQNDDMDFTKLQNGTCKNANCIIINNTDNKQQIKNKEEDIIISSKNDDKEKDEGFIEKIYKLYPTKCPIRGTSLGKSHADKKRIKALLKKYTKEQILMVVENEIKNKYGKYSLKNFSTFLNNFPDPSAICENSTPKQNTLFDNLPTGMIIRETQEERNEKFKNEKGW